MRQATEAVAKRLRLPAHSQQAFVAAVVTKNKPVQKDIMQNMTVAELTEAGMFMTTAPAQCAGGD
jgi:hypothetical protein